MGPASISTSISISLICAAAFHTPLSAQTLQSSASIPDNPNRNEIPLLPDISSSLTSQDPTPASTWELVKPNNINPGLTWQIASLPQANSSLDWQIISTTEQLIAQPAPTEQPDDQPKPSAQTSLAPWIVGLGGGARIGIGEPTYGMVYGRIGREISNKAALSLRPAYIFGNSDSEGSSNSQGAFKMPLTLDLYPNKPISPYAGVGVATNTDSNGNANAMITAGLDINFVKHLGLSLGINYIFQDSDQDDRDVEAFTVLYYRF